MRKHLARYCDFCGKEAHEVFLLIAGPRAFICDECVEDAGNIVAQERIAQAIKKPDPNTAGPVTLERP